MRRSRLPFFLIVGAAILFVVGYRVVWPNVRTDTLHVQMLYSSEEQAWIDSVTQAFNSANHRTEAGKPIVVDTQAVDSGEGMNSILQGTAQPTLWSPASQAWIGLLNAAWTQKQGQTLISEACPAVVNSPVVIMMWKTDAEKLGWPATSIGWADILKLASDPNSTFRFAHTRPDDSDSGLEALISMTYAAAQTNNKLTLADVNTSEVSKYVHALENSVVSYGDSLVALNSDVIQQGETFVNAAVGYESTVVIDYNSAPESPLVAIYPKEGTVVSDHPVCILSWDNAEQREAATIYRDYLLSDAAQQQAIQFGLRPVSSSVAIHSPIDTIHGVDPTQPQLALPMPDTATVQAILDLWKAQKRQVNLILMNDISGNMLDNATKFPAIQQALTAMADQLDANDTVSLLTFHDQLDTIIANQPISTSRQVLKNKINQLVIGNGTNLYDALIEELGATQTDPNRINVLVLLAGTGDTGSTHTLDEVLAAVSKTSINVYTIGYGPEADNNALQQIASAGHGLFYKADATTIQQIYQHIASLF